MNFDQEMCIITSKQIISHVFRMDSEQGMSIVLLYYLYLCV